MIRNISEKKKKNTIQDLKKLFKLREYTKPYILRSNYNPSIPLKIFQTWCTKDLPPKIKETVEHLKRTHPRFEHFLFDDNDCREFIKTHFDSEVLYAYDRLIPGAYKADLWRCCVLYIHGGIYMDIKMKCINGFRLIELTENEHFVKDRGSLLSIFNALMVCYPSNPFLKKAIDQIVINVKNRYYGNNPLYPTGPVMLGKIILRDGLNPNIDLYHCEEGEFIMYKNRFVMLNKFPEYEAELAQAYEPNRIKKYGIMWNERNIYR